MANESLNLWLEDLYGDTAGLKLKLRDCLHSATSAFQRISVYDSHAFGKVLALGGAIALTDFDEICPRDPGQRTYRSSKTGAETRSDRNSETSSDT